ncbi:MAG: hypothetical protein Q9167_007041 [Letrouitia subvulpina]
MAALANYRYLLTVAGLLFSHIGAIPSLPPHGALTPRADTDRLVFCHFMVGIVSDRSSASDYDNDMQRAKAVGIDAFALNIGTDDFVDKQLSFAYESASSNGMSVFLSFDFNWFSQTADAGKVGTIIKQYASEPAQLKVGSKIFVSSFAGDELEIETVRSAAGMDLFLAPNFQPASVAKVDGALNWMAWPNDGNNKAPKNGNNVTIEDGDQAYISALSGKPYIAPVSPWFSTHFGPEVSYSKNFVFPSNLLWWQRWTDILILEPQYVEIITWNDYGESHYVGPLSSPHTDDGASKWANDMPHDGWLEMAKPFISAYKAGSKSVSVDEDKIIYWYRPNPKSINCDPTDTTMGPGGGGSPGNYYNGKPDGAETMDDSVFIVSLLKEAGVVRINSGDNEQTFDAPAGAHAFAVEMGIGKQTFALERGSETILQGTSLKDISNTCLCGIYNFNAYVGSLPAGAPDPLPDSGLKKLTDGLHVATCEAKPSLGTSSKVVSAKTGSYPGSSNVIKTTTNSKSDDPSIPAISHTLSTPPSGPASSLTISPTPLAAPEVNHTPPGDPSHAVVPPLPSTVSVTKIKYTPLSVPTAASISNPSPVLAVASVPPVHSSKRGGGRTITASSQIAPTNCLMPGDVWQVPPPADTPDKCDV